MPVEHRPSTRLCPASRGARRLAAARGFAAAASALLLALPGPALSGGDGHTPLRSQAAAGAARVSAALGEARSQGRDRWRQASLAALTVASWRWLMSIPPGVTPNDDVDGVNCGINQQGPFWYLGGPVGAAFSRSCDIPAGRAIVAPVFAFLNDYPCPDPSFRPAPGQSLEDFLQEGVAPYIDGVSLAQARLNGRSLRVRRIATNLFPFTAADGLTSADPCLTGSPQVGVSDGYWAFIDPLLRGTHTLVLRSVSTFGTTEGTYTLRVR